MTTEKPEEPAKKPRRYYLTTAIDYPNGRPHIGHALEKIIADVVARYHRLQGDDTFLSMGIDENSLHVLTAARQHNTDPQTWIDTMSSIFEETWASLNITYDCWMRTTTERHKEASREMFQRAQQRGDIYKAVYSGWYCPNCNTYYATEDLIGGRCPNHPSLAPEWLDEENYFFALTKYSDQLLAHIEQNPDFITPASRKAEIVGLIRQGLRDFSVSRLVRPGMENWGIPVPGDPAHVIYVWFDALINYLTAVGFPDDPQRWQHYWPADAHLIGKDITRFHCLYWPAMLLSAGLPLPRQIPVHGFITIEGQRISKTLGNVIDPIELVKKVGTDAIRFTLLRNLSMASDSNFSRTSLVRAYNNELGNDLGNLLNRVVSMIKRYRNGQAPLCGAPGAMEQDLQVLAATTFERASAALESWDIGLALHIIWQLVRSTNQYLEKNEPWQLAKDPEQAERLNTVLATAAEVTRLLSILLSPYIPDSCAKMRQQLGLPALVKDAWHSQQNWGSEPVTQIGTIEQLFPRLEPAVVASL